MLNKKALAASLSAKETDSDFKQTVLLLHGDGTNGAQNNTFIDSSTNAFTITRNGNTTQGTFSPFSQTGWSNYFDGDDYLSTSSGVNIGSSDFCIEGWIYSSSSSEQTIIGQWNSSTGLNWILQYRNSPNQFRFFIGGTSIVGTSALTLNQWTHVVACRSGSDVALFVNGTREATATNSSSLGNTTGINVGRNGDNIQYVTGYLSNVRVVIGSSVYSPTSSTLTVPTAPLTAVSGTAFLSCQSNRFIDNSASPLTITVNGNPSVQAFSPFAPTDAYSAGTNGGSGYFDGTTDYLQVADNNALDFGTGDFTVEGWYYSTAATTTLQTVFSVGRYDSGVFLRIGTHPGGDSFYINGTNYNWDPTTYFKSYQWNHVVVARTGTTVGIFVNGTRVFNTTNSDNIVPTTSTTIAGATHDLSGLFFTGYINGFRIIKGSGPYSATSSTLTVPTAPLTAITNTSLLCNFTNAGIIDQTGKNVLETLADAQISSTQVKFGSGSIKFDGTGDGLTVPDSSLVQLGSGNFTIEFWFYPSALTGYVLGKGDAATVAGSAISFQVNTAWDFYYGSSYISVTSPTFTTGSWQHCAVVRNGSTITIYKDGTSVGTGTIGTNTINTGGTNPLSIGRYAGSSANGYIDDLRITKGVARYTANFTAPTKAFADQ